VRETQTSIEKKLRFFIYQGTGLDDYLTKLSNEQSYGQAQQSDGGGQYGSSCLRSYHSVKVLVT